MRNAILCLSLLGLAAGCGPSASSYCTDACDCIGCSDAQYENCIDDYEDGVKAAEDAGCGEQADDLAACVDSEFQCIDGKVDADGCGTETTALAKCLL